MGAGGPAAVLTRLGLMPVVGLRRLATAQICHLLFGMRPVQSKKGSALPDDNSRIVKRSEKRYASINIE
jgi:hypothetical protein